MRPLLSLVSVLVAAVTTLGHAETITQSNQVNFFVASPQSATIGSFNAFNTSLGTLTEVDALLVIEATPGGDVYNVTPTRQSGYVSVNLTSSLTGSPAPLVASFAGLSETTMPAQFFDLYSGQSAAFTQIFPSDTAFYNSEQRTATYTSTPDLAAFENGEYSPTLASIFTPTSNAPFFLSRLDAEGTVQLQILYTYTPAASTPATSSTVTPEPSSIVLLGSGILTMLGLARRRLAHRV